MSNIFSCLLHHRQASQLTQHMCVLLLQLACYDQSKELVLATGYLTDNILTHFLASVFAVSDSCLSQHSKKNISWFSEISPLFFFFAQGGSATILCQPLDVVKTRLMNSEVQYGVSVLKWLFLLSGFAREFGLFRSLTSPALITLMLCMFYSLVMGKMTQRGMSLVCFVSLLQSVSHCLTETAKLGPNAFYKVDVTFTQMLYTALSNYVL